LCENCRREEIENAYKALKLNGDTYPIYNPSLLAASAMKPTLHIKRLKFHHSPNNIRLKGAAFIQKRLEIERENAEKALSLNYGF
jgi:hypothetical protein